MNRVADLTSLRFVYQAYVHKKDGKNDIDLINAITDSYIAGMRDMENERKRDDGGIELYKLEWAAADARRKKSG